MYRHLNILLVCIFTLLPVTKLSACEITLFGNENKPPKYWLENKIPKGILVDMVKYLEKEVDCVFIVSLSPWKRAYYNAKHEKGGIIGLSKTKNRLELFDFSDEMFVDELLIVVKKGNEFDYNSIDDLKGKIIGMTRGSIYGEAFERATEDGLFSVQEDNGVVGRFKKLLAGRIDLLIIGPGIASFDAVIQSDSILSANQQQFTLLPIPFKHDPNFLGFAKTLNKTLLIERINQALRKGKNSGEFHAIIRRHMKEYVLLTQVKLQKK